MSIYGSAEDVRTAFEPLFTRYGMQLVLAGHYYPQSEPMDDTTYVVAGARAKTRPTDQAQFTAVS